MADITSTFPPSKLADLSRHSISNMVALCRDARSRPTTLLLGSGVSASAGVPIWSEFLREVCTTVLSHLERSPRPPSGDIWRLLRNITIALVGKDYWTPEASSVSSRLLEQEALVVAQQIKNTVNRANWIWLVRKLIYRCDEIGSPQVHDSSLLRSIANTCSALSNLRCVITYNYDDLLESYLRESGIPHRPVWDVQSAKHARHLPIYHPHGYLPWGGGPVPDIVLAEDEYHVSIAQPHSWSNIVQLRSFTADCCVFIGLSMCDPSIRRLLRASAPVRLHRHYAFLPGAAADSEAQMCQTLFDKDLHELGVKVIRYPLNRSPDDRHRRLHELIELLQACLVDPGRLWE